MPGDLFIATICSSSKRICKFLLDILQKSDFYVGRFAAGAAKVGEDLIFATGLVFIANQVLGFSEWTEEWCLRK
jgi:hypothetical protein